jgi:hypothetical protein
VRANACAWEALWRRMRRPIGPDPARHAPQLQSVSHPYCRRESPLSPILSLPFFLLFYQSFCLSFSVVVVVVAPFRHCIPSPLHPPAFHTIINASSLFFAQVQCQSSRECRLTRAVTCLGPTEVARLLSLSNPLAASYSLLPAPCQSSSPLRVRMRLPLSELVSLLLREAHATTRLTSPLSRSLILRLRPRPSLQTQTMSRFVLQGAHTTHISRTLWIIPQCQTMATLLLQNLCLFLHFRRQTIFHHPIYH